MYLFFLYSYLYWYFFLVVSISFEGDRECSGECFDSTANGCRFDYFWQSNLLLNDIIGKKKTVALDTRVP